jgi:hypothetical protein
VGEAIALQLRERTYREPFKPLNVDSHRKYPRSTPMGRLGELAQVRRCSK